MGKIKKPVTNRLVRISNSQRFIERASLSQVWTAWKLQKRQTHAAHKDLVGPDSSWRREPVRACGPDQVVLIYTITADADCPNKHSILKKRDTAGKDLNSVW